ncbi:Asp-tRNA(Asn)/Glu-tRNA(Gln) amidotransferase subunit GatC [Desulfovibrio sp. SGI.169]|uniref:Asp-tRNA(Asn)/Glu-tRNA(Gln) amidotransferase subunit GatC n=1 Tax=Desulfovibrio sp. SGI.169 TaxID=3420561 RepID=UPI003D01CBC9
MAAHNTISREEVAHMAALSRLRVSDEEQELFARQFGDILGYMDVLARVDTDNVEPLYSPAQHTARGREDQAVNRRSREEALGNAPEADGEYFIVPRIV